MEHHETPTDETLPPTTEASTESDLCVNTTDDEAAKAEDQPPRPTKPEEVATMPPSNKRKRFISQTGTSTLGKLFAIETGKDAFSTAHRLALAMTEGRRTTHYHTAFERTDLSFIQTLRKNVWQARRSLHVLSPDRDVMEAVCESSPFAVSPCGDVVVVGRGVLYVDRQQFLDAILLHSDCYATTVDLDDSGLVALASQGCNIRNPAANAREATLEVGFVNDVGFQSTELQLYGDSGGNSSKKARAVSDITVTRFVPRFGGSLLAAGNRVGAIRVWQPKALRKCVLSLETESRDLSSVVDIRGEGDQVYVSRLGNGVGNLGMWDLRMPGNGPFVTYDGHTNAYKLLRMDVYAGAVVAGGDDRKVRVWDAERGGMPLAQLEFPEFAKEVCIGGVDDGGRWVGGLCVRTMEGKVHVCGLPSAPSGVTKWDTKWESWFS